MRGWMSVWGLVATSSLTVAGIAQAATQPLPVPVEWDVKLKNYNDGRFDSNV